jgi:hypothetical protein
MRDDEAIAAEETKTDSEDKAAWPTKTVARGHKGSRQPLTLNKDVPLKKIVPLTRTTGLFCSNPALRPP